MAGPDCAAGACLPGSNSVWFLVTLAVAWAMVRVLLAALAVRSWRARRPDATHRVERASPQALVSAVTVAEIQHRLRREAARPVRAPRVVTVLPRASQPPLPRPRRAGGPIGQHDDG